MNFMTKSQTKITGFIFLFIILMFAKPALAQVNPQSPQSGPLGQSSEGAVIKGKAPLNKEVLKVKLPKAQETILPNGLRVVLVENHRIPTFTLQMVVLSGGLSDPADRRGLSAFTASLLR